jgi:hypothetical protein
MNLRPNCINFLKEAYFAARNKESVKYTSTFLEDIQFSFIRFSMCCIFSEIEKNIVVLCTECFPRHEIVHDLKDM